jgi:hypothetical protein
MDLSGRAGTRPAAHRVKVIKQNAIDQINWRGLTFRA